jgi:hypothetical protein
MRKHIMSLIGQYRKPDSWVEDEMGVTLGVKAIEIARETERTHTLEIIIGFSTMFSRTHRYTSCGEAAASWS